MAVSEMNTLWLMDVQGYCSRKIEVVADNEDQAKERACEIFEQIWNHNGVHKYFDLFELEIWEATNES